MNAPDPQSLSPEALLPHRPPMSLPGGIHTVDLAEKSLVSWTEFDERSPFFDASTQTIPATVGIEMMAQTVGLLSGLNFRVILKKEPALGFLLGARLFTRNLPAFAPRERYFTEVNELLFENPLGVFSCRIFGGNSTTLAEAELTVYLTENGVLPPGFLDEEETATPFPRGNA